MCGRPQVKIHEENTVFKHKAFYHMKEKTIYLKENLDIEEMIMQYRHEYGHYVDHVLGWPSKTEQFRYAVGMDRFWLLRNEKMTFMLEELSNSEVIKSPYVSDVLSGIFLNDSKIEEVYRRNHVRIYKHSTTERWLRDEKAVQMETYADLIALYMKGDKEEIKFIEHWFPNMTEKVKLSLNNRQA